MGTHQRFSKHSAPPNNQGLGGLTVWWFPGLGFRRVVLMVWTPIWAQDYKITNLQSKLKSFKYKPKISIDINYILHFNLYLRDYFLLVLVQFLCLIMLYIYTQIIYLKNNKYVKFICTFSRSWFGSLEIRKPSHHYEGIKIRPKPNRQDLQIINISPNSVNY